MQTACKRCGTCCEKGGPVLHEADSGLVETGGIPLKSLFTIRAGEPVNDNVCGGVRAAESNLIKIQGKEGKWTCRFFDPIARVCDIYDQRPMQCRVLECWNIGGFLKVYETPRLTRRKLLIDRPELSALIQAYEDGCRYKAFERIAVAFRKHHREADMNALKYMIRYDKEFRRAVEEKTGLDPNLFPFLFGRPLSEILPTLGVGLT